jgi:hypothetical protein
MIHLNCLHADYHAGNDLCRNQPVTDVGISCQFNGTYYDITVLNIGPNAPLQGTISTLVGLLTNLTRLYVVCVDVWG